MKLTHKTLLLVTLTHFCPALQASCQEQAVSTASLLDLDIKDLMNVEVSTASKKTESATEAPAVMSVISCDEISRFGGNNLTEVLERATNLYFTGGNTFAQNSISLRGDSLASFSRHTLILFDGRPIREGQTGGTVSPFLLAFPLDMVERIEILRGPSSVLYGSGAYAGVINVIPKRPSNEGTEGTLLAKGGSFNTKTTEGHVFWKKDDADLTLAAKYFGNDGWKAQNFDYNQVYSQGNFGEENISVVASGHYKGFKFDSFWLSSKLDVMAETWPMKPAEHRWIYTNLGYTENWNEHWRTEFNATLNQMNGIVPIGSLGVHGVADANSSLIEATHFFNSEKWQGLIGGTANLMIGSAESKDSQGRVLSYDMPQYQNYWYTLYTQIDYEPWKGLKLTAGGQAVKAGHIDWQFVPRAGITYQHEQGWGIKALYGEAYRAAYVNENNINIPQVFKGNSQLKPETIHTFNLQLFYQKNNYQLAATYYHSLEQNLIMGTLASARTGGVESNTNGAKITFEGLELEAKARLLDNRLLFTSSLAYQTNLANGQRYTTTVPAWLGNAGLSYNFDSGISMGLFHNFSSRPYSNALINPQVLNINPVAQPINMMTLKLSADLKKAAWIKLPITLTFYSYNLLDRPVYLPEISSAIINTVPRRSGRSFYLGLEYNFDLFPAKSSP